MQRLRGLKVHYIGFLKTANPESHHHLSVGLESFGVKNRCVVG